MVSRVDGVLGMSINDDAEEVSFSNSEAATGNPYLHYSPDDAVSAGGGEEKRSKSASKKATSAASSSSSSSAAASSSSGQSSRPKSATKKR